MSSLLVGGRLPRSVKSVGDRLTPVGWTVGQWVQFGIGIALMIGAVIGILQAHGVKVGWTPAVAMLRAILQLALVSVLLGAVLSWPWLVLVFIALMLTTASLTGAKRAAELPGGARYAVVAVVAGGVAATGSSLILGLVGLDIQQIIAVAGISIGNAMAASTLTSRNYLAAVRSGVGEVEGWLALGATPSQATQRLRRHAVKEALIPTMDQTRNTGLVTLPGAFVGALFAGLSPVAAGVFQVVVLATILLAQAITSTVFSALVGRDRQLPAAA